MTAEEGSEMEEDLIEIRTINSENHFFTFKSKKNFTLEQVIVNNWYVGHTQIRYGPSGQF
jgi:hypothetical protein